MKKQNGITIIALTITIIVILILAGVTIQTLTGNNGLLTKVGEAKQANEEAGICENIKLAYEEYQIAQHTGADKTAEKIIEDSLKVAYGDNITKVKVKSEKVIVNMNVNNELKTYIYKFNTGEAFEYKDKFDYNGKEKKDLVQGDDITIGTENFRVFYNKDGQLKAIPWYNIELKLDNPKQSASAEKITFSSSKYWYKDEEGNEIENWRGNIINNSLYIEPNHSSNNIQKYVNAYALSLESLEIENVDVRLAQRSELETQGVTTAIRNPKNIGDYWLCSANSSRADFVWYVQTNGNFDDSIYSRGVRPIIVIKY